MPYNQKGGALARDMGVGVGLGNFWDDIYNVAAKVATGAQAVGSVVGGKNSIALVPSGTSSFVPAAGGPFTAGIGLPRIPDWVVPVGGAVVLYLLLRKK